MTDDDNPLCGAECGDGSDCENPAQENGFCWVPSHNPDSDDDNPHGRPIKLTKERADSITSSIAEGKSMASASRMAGIHPTTLANWLDRVDPETADDDPEFDDAPFEYLFARFVRARGLGEDAYVQDIMDIAREEGDLSTLLSMLKQRFPDSWGDVDRGEQAGGVVVNVGEADEHEIDPETLEVQE